MWAVDLLYKAMNLSQEAHGKTQILCILLIGQDSSNGIGL